MINVIENFEINNQLINWEKLKLGDYINLLTGYPFKSKLFNTDGEGKPLIRNRNINNQIPDLYTTEEYDQSYVISSGDILITMDGDFNIAKWSGVESLLNQRVLKINSYNKEIIEQVYLLYSLEEYLTFIHKRTSGTTVKHLKKSDIENLIVPIPPVKEQQKIAEILSTVDEQIEQTDQLIEKTNELKKGLMQQLLTKGIGHTKFKQTDLGEIPVEWKIKKLEEISIFKNGQAHENTVSENGDFILVNSKFISTDGRIYKKVSANLSPLDIDDITMVMSDLPNGKAFAKCFLVPTKDKYTLNQRICAIKSKVVNPKFLYYQLNRNKYFMKFDNGVGQTNLRKTEVLECPILVPSTTEQHKIVGILSSIDEEIEGYKQEKCQFEELKKGLMQQLLTGKTRVKVD